MSKYYCTIDLSTAPYYFTINKTVNINYKTDDNTSAIIISQDDYNNYFHHLTLIVIPLMSNSNSNSNSNSSISFDELSAKIKTTNIFKISANTLYLMVQNNVNGTTNIELKLKLELNVDKDNFHNQCKIIPLNYSNIQPLKHNPSYDFLSTIDSLVLKQIFEYDRVIVSKHNEIIDLTNINKALIIGTSFTISNCNNSTVKIILKHHNTRSNSCTVSFTNCTISKLSLLSYMTKMLVALNVTVSNNSLFLETGAMGYCGPLILFNDHPPHNWKHCDISHINVETLLIKKLKSIQIPKLKRLVMHSKTDIYNTPIIDNIRIIADSISYLNTKQFSHCKSITINSNRNNAIKELDLSFISTAPNFNINLQNNNISKLTMNNTTLTNKQMTELLPKLLNNDSNNLDITNNKLVNTAYYSFNNSELKKDEFKTLLTLNDKYHSTFIDVTNHTFNTIKINKPIEAISFTNCTIDELIITTFGCLNVFSLKSTTINSITLITNINDNNATDYLALRCKKFSVVDSSIMNLNNFEIDERELEILNITNKNINGKIIGALPETLIAHIISKQETLQNIILNGISFKTNTLDVSKIKSTKLINCFINSLISNPQTKIVTCIIENNKITDTIN